jgi:NitT/TauT family transport system ATP-binding protein
VAASIEADTLTKQYHAHGGTLTAFADLTFAVAAGEFVCVVGPTGCGKTSLLRILADLEQASAGTLNIRRRGADVTTRVAMAFQDHGLLPWLSLRDNILFAMAGTSPLARPAQVERCASLLDRVGLTAFANFYPHQVSGGMRQRVNLARAFAVDPHLLLMDEPFVFLDYQTRAALQALLLEQWEGSGKTVVFVTHDLEEAVMLGDRVLVLTAHPGRLHSVLPIDLPRPRLLRNLRSDPHCLRLMETLMAAFPRLAQPVDQPEAGP